MGGMQNWVDGSAVVSGMGNVDAGPHSGDNKRGVVSGT